jgi:hypothetical protein
VRGWQSASKSLSDTVRLVPMIIIDLGLCRHTVSLFVEGVRCVLYVKRLG